MPNAPKSHRAQPRTPEHLLPSRQTEYRGWYQTAAWKRIRHEVFARDHGLCQECLRNGILKATLEHTTRDDAMNQGHADHVKPHKGNWPVFVDVAGIEWLCHPCHSAKTAREMAQ